MIAWLLVAAALLALGFLVYSLTHLHELGLSLTHPRVLVEATLFVVFLGLGGHLLSR